MINNDKKIIALQNKIVDRMLIDIPKLGLNEKTLIVAAKNCNISEGYLGRLLPEGMSDFKKIFFNNINNKMLLKINKYDYSNYKIRDKIFNGVIIRLQIFNKHKLAIKRILISESDKPYNNIKNLWKTADLIWQTAGDKSTDYNYYTKRLLLSWVYISTLLCWLNEKEQDMKNTKLFLNRRINDVLLFGKTSNKLKNSIQNINFTNKIINTLKEIRTIN